ncbi:MAG: DUF2892 domain-containing protein [Candidatus Micrarchaeota archaeon]
MKLFEPNEGRLDRIARIVAGVGLLAGGLFFAVAPLSYAVMLIGLIVTVTGLTGSCALYSLIGFNTMEKPAAASRKKKR